MISIIGNPYVEESYSRQLDKRVQASEMPYGYDHDGPPADTGDYDTKAKEVRHR